MKNDKNLEEYLEQWCLFNNPNNIYNFYKNDKIIDKIKNKNEVIERYGEIKEFIVKISMGNVHVYVE